MIRLRLPSGLSQRLSSQKIAMTSATDRIAASMVRTLPDRGQPQEAQTAPSGAMPTGSAAARQILAICSAGVVM